MRLNHLQLSVVFYFQANFVVFVQNNFVILHFVLLQDVFIMVRKTQQNDCKRVGKMQFK